MIDPKPRRTRKHYSEEFKREAVALFQTAGITAAQVSAELGISQSVLNRWQRHFKVSWMCQWLAVTRSKY